MRTLKKNVINTVVRELSHNFKTKYIDNFATDLCTWILRGYFSNKSDKDTIYKDLLNYVFKLTLSSIHTYHFLNCLYITLLLYSMSISSMLNISMVLSTFQQFLSIYHPYTFFIHKSFWRTYTVATISPPLWSFARDSILNILAITFKK